LKLRWPWRWSELRQKLVLTPEEKRVIIFILTAFVLGLATKCYRDKHPHVVTPADSRQRTPGASAKAKDSPRPTRKRVRKFKLPPTPTATAAESG
jgi:hypothetical protein